MKFIITKTTVIKSNWWLFSFRFQYYRITTTIFILISLAWAMIHVKTQSSLAVHVLNKICILLAWKGKQLWFESRCGWFTAWNKWKWFSLSIFQRNETTMARVSSIYSLQLIEEDSWRTSRLFYEECFQYMLPNRGNLRRKGKRYQLLRHGDPHQTVSRRRPNGPLSDFL